MAVIDNKLSKRRIEEGSYIGRIVNAEEKEADNGFRYIQIMFDIGDVFYVTVVPAKIHPMHILYDIACTIAEGNNYFDAHQLEGKNYSFTVEDQERNEYINSVITEISFYNQN